MRSGDVETGGLIAERLYYLKLAGAILVGACHLSNAANEGSGEVLVENCLIIITLMDDILMKISS